MHCIFTKKQIVYFIIFTLNLDHINTNIIVSMTGNISPVALLVFAAVGAVIALTPFLGPTKCGLEINFSNGELHIILNLRKYLKGKFDFLAIDCVFKRPNHLIGLIIVIFNLGNLNIDLKTIIKQKLEWPSITKGLSFNMI